MRIRASEFERFITASSAARRPQETTARQEFDAALAAVQTNTDAENSPQRCGGWPSRPTR